MDTILDAAFIIAAVSFFKTQFGFSGKVSLLAAFLVAALLSFAPSIAAQFPILEPWITSLIEVIVLFLSAAGSVDAIRQFRKMK